MIDSFTSEYFFLSNFYESPMVVPTVGVCATLEHAFQAMKADNPTDKETVRAASTAGQCKKLGRKVALRDNWEMIKYEVMYDLVSLKFAFDTKLAAKLLSTGEEELVEGNDWGDTYWGKVDGKGSNYLGKILMQRRKNLTGVPF